MQFSYEVKNLKGDIFGGITAGIVALPLALAFGVQSGLGAIYGLYGAMILGMLAALFGGTNTQVSGPTGPMTVVTALVVSSAIEETGSLEAGMGLIIASFILAGVLLTLFGVLKIGKSIRYMPYPVVSGFMSGIGVIIILYQLYPLMGHPSLKSTFAILQNIRTPLKSINYDAFGAGIGTILIIYAFPKLTKAVPSQLVALIVVTLASYYWKLDVTTIGEIPKGFPQLKLHELSNVNSGMFWLILEFGATLAALSAIDSLLTAVIADNITKTKHDSDQELIGQGIGNLVSGLVGGLPGAGATMRTVVNINTGGKTRLSGFLHGVLLLLILLGLGKYVSHIPLCVLAGILITVGIGIIDYRGMRHLKSVPGTDALVLVAVLLITVFGNLLHAVGVGLVLACVLFMKQASDLAESKTTLKRIDGDGEHHQLFKKYQDAIYIKELHGPLFFGFTSKFTEMMQNLEDDLKVLIINMERVPSIDQSGLYALEDAILSLQQKSVVVLLVNVQPQPLGMLKRIDIVPDLIPSEHLFNSLKICKDWIHHYLDGNGGLEKILAEHQEHKQAKVAYRM